MNATDELRARLLRPPSEETLARRRKAMEEIERIRVSILPLTTRELRRLAREEEEASYERSRRLDS